MGLRKWRIATHFELHLRFALDDVFAIMDAGVHMSNNSKTTGLFLVQTSYFRELLNRMRRKSELKAAFRRKPRPARVKIEDPDKPFVPKKTKGWL